MQDKIEEDECGAPRDVNRRERNASTVKREYCAKWSLYEH